MRWKRRRLGKKIVDFYRKETRCGYWDMELIGFVSLKKYSDIEVYVQTYDVARVPHFHVRKHLHGNVYEWDIAIRVDSAKYFEHGKHKGRISTKLATDLDKMFRSIDKYAAYGENKTYWKLAIEMWNSQNATMYNPDDPFNYNPNDPLLLNDDIKQPDYSRLNFQN